MYISKQQCHSMSGRTNLDCSNTGVTQIHINMCILHSWYYYTEFILFFTNYPVLSLHCICVHNYFKISKFMLIDCTM